MTLLSKKRLVCGFAEVLFRVFDEEEARGLGGFEPMARVVTVDGVVDDSGLALIGITFLVLLNLLC